MGWKEGIAVTIITALVFVAGCVAWTDFWTPEGFEEQRPDTIDKAITVLEQAKAAADATGDALPSPASDIAKTLAIVIAAAGTVLTAIQTARQRNAAARAKDAQVEAAMAASDTDRVVDGLRTMTTWVEEVVIPKLTPAEIATLKERQRAEGTRTTINEVRNVE